VLILLHILTHFDETHTRHYTSLDIIKFLAIQFQLRTTSLKTSIHSGCVSLNTDRRRKWLEEKLQIFMKHTWKDARSVLANRCPWLLLYLWGLKQKTDKSIPEFCFIESLSLQSELLIGRKIKGHFTSLSLSHWYHWLCRPNLVNILRWKRKTHRNT
jgi:hypothetical protein